VISRWEVELDPARLRAELNHEGHEAIDHEEHEKTV